MQKFFSSIYAKITLILVCFIALTTIIIKTSLIQNDEWKDKVLLVTSDHYDDAVIKFQHTDIKKLEIFNYIKVLKYRYDIENFNYNKFLNDILNISEKHKPTLIIFCPISCVQLLKNNVDRSYFINSIGRARLVGITSINKDGFFDCIYEDKNSSQDAWQEIATFLKKDIKAVYLHNSSISDSKIIEKTFKDTNNPNLLIFNEYPMSRGRSECEKIYETIKDYDLIISTYTNNLPLLLSIYKEELKNKKWIVNTNLYSSINKKNILALVFPDIADIIKNETKIAEINPINITNKKFINYRFKSFDKKHNFLTKLENKLNSVKYSN